PQRVDPQRVPVVMHRRAMGEGCGPAIRVTRRARRALRGQDGTLIYPRLYYRATSLETSRCQNAFRIKDLQNNLHETFPRMPYGLGKFFIHSSKNESGVPLVGVYIFTRENLALENFGNRVRGTNTRTQSTPRIFLTFSQSVVSSNQPNQYLEDV